MEKVILDRLHPREYEHHFDQKALDALEGTPGLETAVKKFNQYGIEKLLKIQHTGSNIRVSDYCFPELLEKLREVCQTLYLKNIPELYIMRGHEISSVTLGVEKPIIVLTTACVDRLSADELTFVMGHEVGHLKSQHVLYHQMARVLPMLGRIIGSATLGVGELLSYGLQLALFQWREMSEFTADRAGLLACQSTRPAITALMKMAGLPAKYSDNPPVEAFLEQAREFEAYDYNTLDRAAKVISNLEDDQPWTVIRASEFLHWIESGDYDKVRNRETLARIAGPVAVPVDTPSDGPVCQGCGSALEDGVRFCGGCGKPVE